MVATKLCSGAQSYHRIVPDGGITAGMGQDQSGLPRIQTHGDDKAVLWCPAVPLNCARRGHHSRNGPEPEWPPQDSNSWWRQGCALVPSRTTKLCQTGASQLEWARTRVASPGFELMGLTGGLLVKLGVEEEDDGVGVALRRNLPFHLWWSLTPSLLAMLIWPESIATGYWCCSRL
ncbi:hypothetical protein VitviT2T_018047 [Vitis vinifera]|uniref:Uncharacterized protein n=1 Tax=Vitis vinifera TaxID=29760 RepID=A0ABY9CWT6_VITVI|nr:hypothetical protein VitviT2T_018047 [Vitis vinifera]